MKDDTSIVVENVSKVYRIWDSPAARARSLVWQTLRGIIPAGKGWFRKQEERHYADFPALRDISFTVARGESVAIIGRNGSGKSTLLQLIVGTLQPTNGTIKTYGRVAALLELGSGFDPEFTGRENVYLNAGILGLTKAETEARFADIEAFADIGDFIDQPVKTYSSGMMMRLAFAVIAHVDADILIVDEALAVGDVFFVQKCMRFIREFQKTGTLLLVTHDTSAVTSLCQRAVWLHQGECEGIGTAKEIAELYLEAIYAERQGVTFKKDNSSKKNTVTARNRPIKDQREKFIQHSNLRNDIKIFDFNRESSAFGAGGAVIEHVSLLEAQSGNQLSYVIGGEEVILRVEATSNIHLDRPIIGFSLKNHLGQELFGDNSFLTYLDSPYPVAENSKIVAQFRFQMPYLPAGNYMICAAIANGTQENHIQHHWLHEALAFQSHSSHCVGGLVGIPMLEITLSKETDISR